LGLSPFGPTAPRPSTQALCAPNSDAKSWESWSFIEIPDCPQTKAPNIVWVQVKGPKYYCICKSQVNEPTPPPPRSSVTGLPWRYMSVPRAFCYMSFCFPNKSFPDRKTSPFSQILWERNVSCMFHRRVPYGKRRPYPEPSFIYPSGVPVKDPSF
jgi:hypothetical protein